MKLEEYINKGYSISLKDLINCCAVEPRNPIGRKVLKYIEDKGLNRPENLHKKYVVTPTFVYKVVKDDVDYEYEVKCVDKDDTSLDRVKKSKVYRNKQGVKIPTNLIILDDVTLKSVQRFFTYKDIEDIDAQLYYTFALLHYNIVNKREHPIDNCKSVEEAEQLFEDMQERKEELQALLDEYASLQLAISEFINLLKGCVGVDRKNVSDEVYNYFQDDIKQVKEIISSHDKFIRTNKLISPAKWILHEPIESVIELKCSNCKYLETWNFDLDENVFPRYCPNCGKRMSQHVLPYDVLKDYFLNEASLEELEEFLGPLDDGVMDDLVNNIVKKLDSTEDIDSLYNKYIRK